MCFAHSGRPSDTPRARAGVGVDAAGLGSVEATGAGTPDRIAAPDGERVLAQFAARTALSPRRGRSA